MEEELHCPACSHLFTDPVLLPCSHASCLKCAINLERPLSGLLAEITAPISSDPDLPDGGDSDKGSVYSETDSGVVVASRPGSYLSNPETLAVSGEGPQSGHVGLKCPSCQKVIALGPGGAQALPKFTAMTRIIRRHKGDLGTVGDCTKKGGIAPPCQLCEGPPRPATTECKQCMIQYCSPCLNSCHPQRGPLATHILGPVAPIGPGGLTGPCIEVCLSHGEKASLYCMVCRWSGCAECAPMHSQHDLQPLDHLSKTQKAELSESLQHLSERAKSAHTHITTLKNFQDKVNSHCDILATELDRQCNDLIAAVETARMRLADQLMRAREATSKNYRDQTSACTRRLQQTTSLVQFCIEAIKEPDPVAFMQMGPQLIGRVSDLELTWDKELTSPSTRLSPYVDLDLDHKSVLRTINTFNFVQMKPAFEGEERKPAAPGPPEFLSEECVGENNSVTATWVPPPTSRVTGYALEIDDGDGEFKEVYRGPETICTVEGLHFNSVYQLRVRAYNSSGVSPYSSLVSIRTSATAWFSLDLNLSHPECRILSSGTGVTCESYEHRVALASVGFSRGRHFWQFSVDSYDANADVIFGVARVNVNKEIMLGKDPFGWAMYIDHQRSWFLHDSAHHGRCQGGVGVGATIGVLLDLNLGTLAFFVNDEQQGDAAFSEMEGLFYPAVSINRNVCVTLHTSVEPPHAHSDYDSQSDT